MNDQSTSRFRQSFVRRLQLILLGILGMTVTLPLLAMDDVYQRPSEFIKETFGGTIPKAGAVELTRKDQVTIKKLMGHPYRSKRIRFWNQGNRTAWILNEIGKTKPITTGYVLRDGRVEKVKVLIFRESHGWEVRQKFFTRQFVDVELNEKNKLSKRIDNVAGATLSVRALTDMAKLALYLEKKRLNP